MYCTRLGSQSSREYILFPREYTFIPRLCLRSYCLVFSPHMPFLPMFCSLLVHCSPPISCAQFPAQVAVCRCVYVPNGTRPLVRPLRSPYPLPLHSAMQPVLTRTTSIRLFSCYVPRPRTTRGSGDFLDVHPVSISLSCAGWYVLRAQCLPHLYAYCWPWPVVPRNLTAPWARLAIYVHRVPVFHSIGNSTQVRCARSPPTTIQFHYIRVSHKSFDSTLITPPTPLLPRMASAGSSALSFRNTPSRASSFC